MKKVMYILSFVCLFVVSYVGYFYINPAESGTHFNFVFNPDNKKELVGASHNVFIGEVVEQTGTKQLSDFPETQYKVKVMSKIKGELEEMVTVNQFAGYYMNQGRKTLVKEYGDDFLVSGKKYMFVTLKNDKENWHSIIPVYGNIQLTSDNQAEETKKEFENAYLNEVKTKFK